MSGTTVHRTTIEDFAAAMLQLGLRAELRHLGEALQAGGHPDDCTGCASLDEKLALYGL